MTLRDMSREAIQRAELSASQLAVDGLPNYFDDQRFGSVGFGGGFIAEAWLKGDHEAALRMAIAEATASDRPEVREEKQILRESWGRWPEAKAALPKSHARSLVTYLVDHPSDFRGAFARLRRDLRSIYFSAFQSFLWNTLLGRRIEQITRTEQRMDVDFKVATLPMHRGLDPDQAEALKVSLIPLPASRSPLPEGPMRDLALDVLAARGLTWETLRVKHLKDVFFSKGTRPALFFPEALKHSSGSDDLYPGRGRLDLSFDLPKGAYATLVVKRLTESG